MFQVIEKYQGVTRQKMVGSYKNCIRRAEQLRKSHRKDYGYNVEVVETDEKVKFNTRTPGIWHNYNRSGPKVVK